MENKENETKEISASIKDVISMDIKEEYLTKEK